MGFTQNDVNTLLEVTGNDYLLDISVTAYSDNTKVTQVDKRFEELKSTDPFPEIESALLNSKDIIKYILTTGMIAPFCPENLKGATYTCTFSGTYLRYNSKGEVDASTISDEEELIIEPNSITYLEISEKFRIPLYLILRFNLKVQNVYKGLLLGTGPIVDPGFVGKLYIPLHNLTLNKYIIKKGAELISVEFTKLSIKNDWKISKSSTLYKSKIQPLVFSGLPKDIQKKIKPDRDISEYIKKSLQGDSNFHKEPINELSVGSSLAEYVVELNEMDKKIKSALDDINKTKKKTDSGVRVGVIALVITVAALLIPICQSYDAIHRERVEYNESISRYQETISDLQIRLTLLEIGEKKEQLDLLKDEYASIVDRNSDLAKKINEQIIQLEKEIERLQIQSP